MFTLYFFLKFIILSTVISLSITFIDRKFNISNILKVKYKSLILIRAVELIIEFSLVLIIASHTNVDSVILAAMSFGFGSAVVRRV